MKARERKLENWRDTYQRKLVGYQEAAEVIKSGDNIFIPNTYSGQMPYAIAARQEELQDVTVEVQAPRYDPGWLSPGMEGSFNVIVRIYMGPVARQGHDEGTVTFLPYTNGTWFKPYRDNRAVERDIDVFLVDVSPPDENGFMTFGAYLWERRNYAQRAKTIIAEIDPHQIRSHGDTSIHVSEVDYIVDMSTDSLTEEELELLLSKVPPELREQARESLSMESPARLKNILNIIDDIDIETFKMFLAVDEPNQTARSIAENLKTVITDRSAIQIGMGRPSRYMVQLGVFDDFKDLSLFSEMACPGMGFLVRRGIATGKYATLHPGKAVFASLSGFTHKELQWADDNPLFEQYSSDYVVNIANVSKNENMIAINNAIQVDLTGQITCESQFGSRLINGPGGQIEFHIGAFCAPGGKAVTLLPSTWGEGSVSTITPYLEEGTMVTIPRAYADLVITEYGVAELLGKTHRERATALIKVAHPNFREELSKAAAEIF
jgi:4-hydroxybutyrate CoA-transferase